MVSFLSEAGADTDKSFAGVSFAVFGHAEHEHGASRRCTRVSSSSAQTVTLKPFISIALMKVPTYACVTFIFFTPASHENAARAATYNSINGVAPSEFTMSATFEPSLSFPIFSFCAKILVMSVSTTSSALVVLAVCAPGSP